MWELHCLSRKAVIKFVMCSLLLLVAGTILSSMAYIGLDGKPQQANEVVRTPVSGGDYLGKRRTSGNHPQERAVRNGEEGAAYSPQSNSVRSRKSHQPNPHPRLLTPNQIDNLKRIGERRVFTAKSLKQLHHGIYETVVSIAEEEDEVESKPKNKKRQSTSSPTKKTSDKDDDVLPRDLSLEEVGDGGDPSLLRFAFKTECRPPAKWHGQQGWGEVAVHILLSLWETFDRQRTGRNNSVASEVMSGNNNNNDQYTFENSVPFSVGGIVWVSSEMLKNVVHKDQCGLMDDGQIRNFIKHLAPASNPVSKRTMSDLQKYLDRKEKLMTSSLDSSLRGTTAALLHYPFIGVILKWMPSHDDGALPTRDQWLDTFILPNKKVGGVSGGPPSSSSSPKGKILLFQGLLDVAAPASMPRSHFSKGDLLSVASSTAMIISAQKKLADKSSSYSSSLRLEVQRQISDVMMFDYILGNEDRETKNWFRDGDSGRYILMDNGFVFSGRGYKESICGMYPALLTCPPLLRHLSKSSTCKTPSSKSGGGSTVGLCIFRPETVAMLEGLKTAWLSPSPSVAKGSVSLAQLWVSLTGSDILLQFLTSTFSNLSTSTFDMPLARHRDARNLSNSDCAMLLLNAAKLRPFDSSDSLTTVGANPRRASSQSNDDGLSLIALAIDARINRLLDHVKGCVSRYGTQMVFSHP